MYADLVGVQLRVRMTFRMKKPGHDSPMAPPEERFEDQRRAAGIARTDNMWWVYILELKPDDEGQRKYYVGHTCRLQRRIHDHMTGNSVAWVRRWGVQSVQEWIRTTEESALGLEIAKATELKARYGWHNVRGGVDNNPRESPVPSYWSAPASGLDPASLPRTRSRSPTTNLTFSENGDDS